MNEKEQKIKEYNNIIQREKRVKEQWDKIEENIDKVEIKHNTERIAICKQPLYEENKQRLINEFGFKNIKSKLGICFIELSNNNEEDETDRNSIKTIDELHDKINNDINKNLNKLNEDFLDKYNLNDGQHNNRKDDVFSRRINKENKIDFDEIKRKEDKLETFADLINQVLGFKYC